MEPLGSRDIFEWLLLPFLLNCTSKHWEHFIFLHLVVFINWISPYAQSSVLRAHCTILYPSDTDSSLGERGQLRGAVQFLTLEGERSPAPALCMTKPLCWHAMAWSLYNTFASDFLPSSSSLHFSFHLFQPLSSSYPLLEARETLSGDTLSCPSNCISKYHQSFLRAHKSPYHRLISLCTKARAKDKLLLCKIKTQGRGGRG